ncbi:MAG: TetR/AcrR family transcriptional regulator [Acidobacteriaceae bacterium]
MKPQTPIRKRELRADQTQKRILRAAVQEFSTHGLSGARTDRIAESAKANKALLYYYFKSKQGLYAASVESVAARVVENALAEFDPKYSAGEKLLRSALNHFDRILTQREFQSLMQQEMIRFRSGKGGSIPVMFKTAFAPLIQKMHAAVEDGIRTGELCRVDWLQVVYSIFGANVFYFLSAPMMELALPFEPFGPEALKHRREVVVQFLGTALFADRSAGAKLAHRILREMPMPRVTNVQARPENFHARRKTL